MSNIRMTEEERAQFLGESHVAIIAVERDDAAPLAVPVWYGVEKTGEVVVWTERGTIKERLIRASGRLTLAVQNENPPYGYVSVEGPAVIQENVSRDDVRFIVERYLPASEVDAHLDEMFNDRAVLVVMHPNRWYTADYGKPAE